MYNKNPTATLAEIQLAFCKINQLTSLQLVDFYMQQIDASDSKLKAVIVVNPDARSEAENADIRIENRTKIGDLDGIPVFLKDNINTKGNLSTAAGSFALFGAKVDGDATVVKKLRDAGAVILGKASMSEWCDYRYAKILPGWCARSRQGVVSLNLR